MSQHHCFNNGELIVNHIRVFPTLMIKKIIEKQDIY